MAVEELIFGNLLSRLDNLISILEERLPILESEKAYDHNYSRETRYYPVVFAKNTPFRQMEHVIARIVTSSTEYPKIAQAIVENKFDSEQRNMIVTFVFNANMKTKGQFKVIVNGVSHLEIQNAGDLTDLKGLIMHTADVHDVLKPREKIEVFVKSSDGSSVALTVGYTGGEYI